MKPAPPQHRPRQASKTARRPGPAPMRKAAMGRPYGLNHVAIGPAESGPEAQARAAASRVMRGEKAVGRELTAAPAAAVATPSRGEPLPAVQRLWLEQGFGADLGVVRIHRDAEAATAARAEHAQAFTAGRDIYFGQGRYDPNGQEGRSLLAHEVAHVLQQTAVGGPDHRLRASEAAGAGEVQRLAAVDDPALARPQRDDRNAPETIAPRDLGHGRAPRGRRP